MAKQLTNSFKLADADADADADVDADVDADAVAMEKMTLHKGQFPQPGKTTNIIYAPRTEMRIQMSIKNIFCQAGQVFLLFHYYKLWLD